MTQRNQLMIGGLRLVLTCGACPEQYDVYDGDEQVGYLRLRHGRFRAEVPHSGGRTVYEGLPMGDGIFLDEERDRYLTTAVRAIQKSRGKGKSGGRGRK